MLYMLGGTFMMAVLTSPPKSVSGLTIFQGFVGAVLWPVVLVYIIMTNYARRG
jgi:hypothetical protein